MIPRKMIVYLSFYLLTQNLRLVESIEDAPASKGVVVLDSLTFNKTISAFRYSFVSFTISSFTQSLHQLTEEQKQKDMLFADLALTETLSSTSELLIAQVDVKENTDLAKRFRVEDERVWPELILFTNENFQGCSDIKKTKKSTSSKFKETRYGSEISANAILGFIKGTTSLPLTLPGCLPRFDVLAQLFIHSPKDERNNVIKDTEKLSDKCCNKKLDDKLSAQRYVQLMKSSIDHKDGIRKYFEVEENRLKRIFHGKITDKKKDEIFRSINIITSFKSSFYMKNSDTRDEL